jgi:hypothetical protein
MGPGVRRDDTLSVDTKSLLTVVPERAKAT